MWSSSEERSSAIAQLQKAGTLVQEKAFTTRAGESQLGVFSYDILRVEGEELIVTTLEDVTDRRRAEKALAESESSYRALFENAGDAIFLMNGPRILDCNQKAEAMYGVSREQFLAVTPADLSPEYQPNGRLSQELILELVGLALGGEPQRFEWLHVLPDGRQLEVEVSLVRITLSGQARLLAIARDITERRQTENRIRQQMERMSSLRAIDVSISNDQPLERTVQLIFDPLQFQMHVDAVEILLLDHSSGELRHFDGRGFRSRTVSGTRLKLGEGTAGRVAYQMRIQVIPDLSRYSQPGDSRKFAAAEGFKACVAAPLVSNGRVKGVLQVFFRKPCDPDREWLDYLELLAGQAAIAVENHELLENLQKANHELSRAYETTLEGWSRTLSLRDRETEDHTRRVTELAVELAKELGIQDERLQHIRRGALLHDIGKIGIPDRILLKPGPLDEADLEVIRKHPTFASDLLEPIEYLRLSLAIPYSHHERWDGTGYPQGLAGEAIPLEARIFAVVDAYDALTSGRPYRDARSSEETLEHIQSEAGRAYDPRVVDAFVALMQKRAGS